MQENNEDKSRINYTIIDKLCVDNQDTLEGIYNCMAESNKQRTMGIACLSAAMATIGLGCLVQDINGTIALGMIMGNLVAGLYKSAKMTIYRKVGLVGFREFVDDNIKDVLAMNTNPVKFDFYDEDENIVNGDRADLLLSMYNDCHNVSTDESKEEQMAKFMLANEFDSRIGRNVMQLLEENNTRIERERE